MVRNYYGKIEFDDDDSVELNCGCVATAGDSYKVFTVKHVKDLKNHVIVRTCCNKVSCENETLYGLLEELADVSCDEEQVKTAYEEYCGYIDYIERE